MTKVAQDIDTTSGYKSEYYRRKLIFTNNKAVKTQKFIAKVLAPVRITWPARKASPVLQPKQESNSKLVLQFAMTRKTSSGIDNLMHSKGYGRLFQKLFPLVESRDSCNLENGIEPSFGLLHKNMGNTSNIERLNVSSESSETDSISRE